LNDTHIRRRVVEPVLKLELGAIPVPVHQHQRAIAVVLDEEDAGVPAMPSAGADDGLRRWPVPETFIADSPQAAPARRVNPGV
jgi:hypothetical protein